MDLKDYIESIPGFPKEGIVFRDVTPILQNANAMRYCVDQFNDFVKSIGADVVIGPEARGFLFGVPVALENNVGFVPVRKPGKLPRETVNETYDLEYGQDELCVHADAILPGQKVVIIDDLLATGGTVEAIIKMVERMQASVVGVAFVIDLDDLKGIEKQKEKVIQNTLQFLNGLPANDVLLTGSRGTGKSSIVRALLTEYANQGLRLIEIERDDLSELPEIQKIIQHRPEKFIVYCDDLAFNAEDENYRSLKSVLDGSLQSGSSNFIIYATSNRRHLLPEFMHENTPVTRVDVPQYTELHPQEAIEEKISLSDRFGMWLSFYPMDQNLYLEIVEHYLQKAEMELTAEARAEALRWCQARGQRSGRAAYQFSKHWIGSAQLKQL